jgi:CheY-like chemotaxis protein
MEAHYLRAQRMEAIGALAGGVAHDLNNILAPIMMVTGVLREKLTDVEDRELLAMAQSSSQRGAEIVKQLLTFSRGQDGERTLVQLRHLLGEMITMVRETFPRSIDLKQLLPGTLWTVLAEPTQLHQVLLNLCVNARDAMPDGGRLTVSAANVTLAEGDPKLPLGTTAGPYVVISIADSGHGIPAEIQHRIFDPFFTTKPVGKGTGLGLSTALGIVQSHRGFLDLESAVGSGTTFHVYLPAIPDGVATTSTAPAPRATPLPTGQTILVVDDERDVRDSIRIILESENFTVITATDGEAGLAQYLKHRARLNLVITDLMMPKMNGLTLIRTLRAIDPLVKVVVTSGLTEVTERRELTHLGIPDILMKPYDGPALLELVRTRLAAP